MRRLDLTVLFATRNGEKILPRTLSAYRDMEQSGVSWKLVIVDNGSSDSTLDLIKSFKEHLPIEVCFEPIAGKNRALNRGLDAVEGRLVVLTDDDTFPSPSFLQAWAKFLDGKRDYGLLGGTIIPLFEVAPQSWLTADQEQLIMLFGARDLAEGPVEPLEIFGGNMAVRRFVFDNGFRFDENIGPNGRDPTYPMGSEAEFCLRVANGGISSWFAKEPVVHHLVRSYQTTDSYLADRSYRSGRGQAYLLKKEKGKHHEHAPRGLISRQITALRGRLALRSRVRMLSPFPFQRRRAIQRYYFYRGFSDELNS